MNREDLLRSKEYWMVQVQNELYGVIENYMKKNNLNRTGFADKIGVSRGYVTQVLKGDFDHKISKLVELSLSVNKAPVVNFIDLDTFVKNDANNLTYEIYPIYREETISFANQKVNSKFYNSYTNLIPADETKVEAVLISSN
ncbi:MAG: hypothetical protein SFU87_11405 [Chitinophagaceae bacterium]|nr:hypothetical protein [Chitinophagaceae bacterium]